MYYLYDINVLTSLIITYNQVAIKQMQWQESRADALGIVSMVRLDKCYHPHLLQVYAVSYIDAAATCLLLEHATGGSLRQYVRSTHDITLSQQIHFCAEISNGMAFLEDRSIPHKQLCARNVLLGHGNIVKISDYASHNTNKFLRDQNSTDATSIKTRRTSLAVWLAPETQKHDLWSVKADVWSFGGTLFEIFTRSDEFCSDENIQKTREKLLEGYEFPKPTCCPYDVYEVMKCCWSLDPQRRNTFQQLYNFFDVYVVTTG